MPTSFTVSEIRIRRRSDSWIFSAVVGTESPLYLLWPVLRKGVGIPSEIRRQPSLQSIPCEGSSADVALGAIQDAALAAPLHRALAAEYRGGYVLGVRSDSLGEFTI